MAGHRRRRKRIKVERPEEKFYKMVKTTKEKFPFCYGKYPDCPEIVKQLQERKWHHEEVPRDCQLCPFYKW